MKGILLFGHGARNPDWAKPFHAIAEIIRRNDSSALVDMGFLELMRPTLDEGIDRLVSAGATQVVIVPIFMAAGSHIKKDLPALAAIAMDRHTGLDLRIALPVGEVESVLVAMANYAMQVTGE